jgi:hypothetical protein
VEQERLRTALKDAAGALAEAEVPYALGGGYALWVHGAPEPSHDVDLVIAEDDVERARKTLQDAGFAVQQPPENWLFKAYVDDVLVDVLFRISGVPVEASLLDTATTQQVLGMWMPVLPPTCIVVAKLLALNEHYCDFAMLLPVIRAVREQLDWAHIAEQTAGNDFAVAFLVLVERLGLIG